MHRANGIMVFDSHSDVAAVVFADGDDPGRMLCEFVGRLRRSGRRVCGMVQIGDGARATDTRLPFMIWPGAQAIALRHDGARHTAACRLDPREVARTRRQLATAMIERPDLVVINRFGKLEANGAGFAGEIRQAVVADIPVVVAVPQTRFDVWVRFCQGMSVKVDCSAAQLDNWWRRVAVPSRHCRRQPMPTICEIVK